MKTLMRLAVPAGLGLAAAAVNWMVVTSRIAAHPFVVVRQEIKAGEPIEASALGRVDLPGDPGAIKASLVPFSERDVVVGTLTQRDLFPGDFLLWQDSRRPEATIPAEPDEHILPVDLGGVAVETSLLIPGSLMDFWVAPPLGPPEVVAKAASFPAPSPAAGGTNYRLIGPFRLLSIGGRFSQAAGSNADRGGPKGNERVISVAVKVQTDGSYEPASRQLLDAHAQRRIMAVALRPRAWESAKPAASAGGHAEGNTRNEDGR